MSASMFGGITEADAVGAVGIQRGEDGAVTDNRFIARYLGYAMNQTGSPAAYHVGIALALLSMTVPPMFCTTRGFLAPTISNIWVVLIGRSGEAMKTIAIGVGKRLIDAAGLVSVVGADPASEEALVKDLARKPHQILVYDELGSFFANTSGGRTNYRARILDSLTDIYDGNTKDRSKAARQLLVKEPRVSFLGGCTPSHLEEYTTSLHWEGGFMSRALILFANSERDVELPEENWGEWNWLVDRLRYLAEVGRWYDSKFDVDAGRMPWYTALEDPRTMEVGRCRGLTEEAAALWSAWRGALRERTRALPDRLAGIGSRAPLMAAKIATLLTWDRICRTSTVDQDWSIEPLDLQVALAIAEQSFQSSMDLVKRLAPTEDARYKRLIYGVVGAEWTPQATILAESGLLKNRASLCLETLLEEGAVEREVIGKTIFWKRTGMASEDQAIADSDEMENLLRFPIGSPAVEQQLSQEQQYQGWADWEDDGDPPDGSSGRG